MDIKTNEQNYIDVRCLRIPTRRQKIRKLKKGREKELLRLSRERKRLWKAQREKIYIELSTPYQSGWRRSFELRQDVARSRYSTFFSEILNVINTVQYSHRKDFKIKGRKFGRKIYKPRSQELLQLRDGKWRKLGLKQQELFHEIWTVDHFKKPVRLYEFNEPWRFILRVKPNIIRRAIVINPAMESEVAELEGRIDREFLEPAIDRLLDGRARRYWKRGIPNGPRCRYKKTLEQYQDLICQENFT
ncbi:MAG: hypothetical protein ABW007_23655 [Chitinophagaceae bacterium]